MDAFGNDWNTAPACVLSTVWGTASIRDLAVEVGAVPASPIRQVLTARQAGCAGPQSSARASLWICGQHKSVAHNPTGTTAATDNLNNLEISSVRTTPGSPSAAALQAAKHGCYDPFRHLCAGSDSRSHHALATLIEVIAGGKTGWVLEADLKNFFGSLDHEWVLRFVEHRVGDPRLISLIRRWLKAGVLEDGAVHPSEQGTPQGGSISVLLSNVYLHYVLDLWFERVVKGRLRGQARLVRYIDDFVICFQYRSDAIRVQDALRLRLGKFGLTLEPTKTKLVEFGRFAQRHAGKRGRNRPETIYFLGLTLYCTRNRKGNFKVGMRTEKSRLRRSLTSLQELMQQIRHQTISDQVGEINAFLRGHYAYYGVAGNLRCLAKVYRAVERYWHRMLRSRSWAGRALNWSMFNQIKERTPLLRPKLRLRYPELQALAVL
jgi:RNA-directed DNA polymerase